MQSSYGPIPRSPFPLLMEKTIEFFAGCKVMMRGPCEGNRGEKDHKRGAITVRNILISQSLSLLPSQ